MILQFALDAMRTRFELVLIGADAAAPALRALAEEVFAEIEECESRLSLFHPGSLLSLVNREAASRPIGVDRETFDLLLHCRDWHDTTHGAFDPTIAPLMKAWRLHGDPHAAAPDESLTKAQECVGMHHVELDSAASTVRFSKSGVSLDLGGIAKGHALSLAERVLRRATQPHSDLLQAALLHAGTSSVTAIGAPLGQTGWRIAITDPDAMPGDRSVCVLNNGESRQDEQVGTRRSTLIAELCDLSLSVSSPRGRAVTLGSRTIHHIMDPRTGASATGASLAAAIGRDPVEVEALSTALVVIRDRPTNVPDNTITLIREAENHTAKWRIEGADAARVVYVI